LLSGIADLLYGFLKHHEDVKLAAWVVPRTGNSNSNKDFLQSAQQQTGMVQRK